MNDNALGILQRGLVLASDCRAGCPLKCRCQMRNRSLLWLHNGGAEVAGNRRTVACHDSARVGRPLATRKQNASTTSVVHAVWESVAPKIESVSELVSAGFDAVLGFRLLFEW